MLFSFKANTISLKIIYSIISTIFSLVVGGGNFVVALSTIVVFGISIFFLLINKKKKYLILPIICLFCVSITLIISARAPGNAIRQGFFQGMDPFLAIYTAFIYAFTFLKQFVGITPILGVLCISPILYGLARNMDFSFSLPGIISIFIIGVYASSFVPTLYVMSSLGANRVMNINYFIAILCIIFFIFYWSGWISHNFFLSKEEKKKNKNKTIKGTAVLVGVFIFVCIVTSINNKNYMTSISAMHSLASREAKIYHTENKKRNEIYHDSKIKQVKLKEFTKKPYVLFFSDIEEDATNWHNVAVANFYEKESVELVK